MIFLRRSKTEDKGALLPKQGRSLVNLEMKLPLPRRNIDAIRSSFRFGVISKIVVIG